jgi:ribonucleoside-diphosphate reductase alpha chain
MPPPSKSSRSGSWSAASRRQKWIDQAQSLNLYINNASGKKLDITYRMAWYSGLKTTYYLRSLAATGTEKSTDRHGHAERRVLRSLR